MILDSGGISDVAVSSSASVRVAMVAAHDIASGEYGLYVTRGKVHATNLTSGNFTAGHGIETDGGNIEGSGAAFGNTAAAGAATNTDFAVALESGTTVTELDICLHGFAYLSST
jgi:hypothetical protein